tara:strand:+ start:4957 stop:5067 length:111 start_codon:yes stop_codon:yes gene_type:complete
VTLEVNGGIKKCIAKIIAKKNNREPENKKIINNNLP